MNDLLDHELQQLLHRICDSRTGLFTSSEPYTRSELPINWLGWTSQVGNTTHFSDEVPWKADPYGFGASSISDSHAAGASIGEAVERYCGNYVPQQLTPGSYNTLKAQGYNLVDPKQIALYSSSQYTEPGFPFCPFERDHETLWTVGSDLATGTSCLMPAPLVYLDYYKHSLPGEKPISALQYAGIATGPTKQQAIQSAALELVERDSTALWWFLQQECDLISDFSETNDILGRLGESCCNRIVSVYSIPNQLEVPVAVAVVEDTQQHLLTFGSAARFTFLQAAEKAIVEALAVAAISADLADEHGPTRQHIADGTLPAHLYVPHRPDRSYADDYPAPFRNMLDLPSVGQYYLDPRAQKRLKERFHKLSRKKTSAECSAIDITYSDLTERLGAFGACVADLTTNDIRKCGLSVVRILAPGLYGNSPPAYPLLGGKRLYENINTLPEFTLPLPLA